MKVSGAQLKEIVTNIRYVRDSASYKFPTEILFVLLKNMRDMERELKVYYETDNHLKEIYKEDEKQYVAERNKLMGVEVNVEATYFSNDQLSEIMKMNLSCEDIRTISPFIPGGDTL